MKAKLLSGLALVFVAVACNAKIAALDDRACPCTSGYTCCATTQECVAPGEVCVAEQTIPNVSDAGTADANDGSDPGDVSDFPPAEVNGAPMPAPDDTKNVPFLPSTAPAGKLRVFISSTTHDGNLGGFDGADAFCRKTANAAGLGGKWVAFLNGQTVQAADRVQGDGPWYFADGTTLDYPNHDSISQPPRAATPEDENAQLFSPVEGPVTWYGGSTPMWTACADWTTTANDGESAFEGWTEETEDPCTTQRNLLCFEQP